MGPWLKMKGETIGKTRNNIFFIFIISSYQPSFHFLFLILLTFLFMELFYDIFFFIFMINLASVSSFFLVLHGGTDARPLTMNPKKEPLAGFMDPNTVKTRALV